MEVTGSDVNENTFGGEVGKVYLLRDFDLDDLTAPRGLEEVQPLIRRWVCCCARSH